MKKLSSPPPAVIDIAAEVTPTVGATQPVTLQPEEQKSNLTPEQKLMIDLVQVFFHLLLK